MRLVDLEPEFLTITESNKLRQRMDDFATAQGIMFLCPRCFEENKGPVGTHMVICWFRDRGVPEGEEPMPGRWIVSGTGYTDLTLSPSVLVDPANNHWHGYIENGLIRTC